MFQTLLLLLVLVPAPKMQAPAPTPHPLIGAQALDWGEHCEQTTFFYADGTCYSPEFGAGAWAIDSNNNIWFSERDGTAQYVMRVDLLTGEGDGAFVAPDGSYGGNVTVRLKRGERLPMPRVVE